LGVATDDSLADLLAASARGDRTAFRRLYEATAPKLFAIVLRITRNRSVAEEVLQETFVKVWRKAERFQPEAGAPMAWLTAITRNLAIDRLRSERIERYQDDGEAILARLPAPGGDDALSREALRICLGALDEEARACVLLAYCSGFSREELAERFGRPVGTIKTLLHRSLKLLRTCLETE
jgi:RNA polymerase sigma-70 factor (ECF subfamily)